MSAPGATRTRRYESRMADRGYVRKHLWVPKDRGAEIEQVAERMRREHVLATVLDLLHEREPDLKAEGIRHAAVFGSTAKLSRKPDSDVDVVVELIPGFRMSALKFLDIEHGLSERLGLEVTLCDSRVVAERMGTATPDGAIRAF